MSEIKLFNTIGNVEELVSSEVLLEKELQNLIENNMESFFGVRFLKSEFPITNGRMDSLGIDENYCPVIFEYKRSINENVINQGLFYLDWLLDHKADFKLLVIEKLGIEEAEKIDWSVPCVVCVANEFTKFDLHAVNQMQRNIRLVKYKKYDGLILFEHLNSPIVKSINTLSGTVEEKKSNTWKTHEEKLKNLSGDLLECYEDLCNYIEALGDDIVANQVKDYIAYKKVQNVVCIEIFNKHLLVFLKIDPEKITLEDGFSKDMRNVGHHGTGDLQVTVKNKIDVDKVKALIDKAYYEN